MATRARRHHERLLANARADQEAALASLEQQLERLVSNAPEEAEADFSEEGGDPDVNVIERDRIRARISETHEHLDKLDRAMASLEEGTYGTCRVCGEEIPEERLEILPETRLCVRCKADGHQS